jgi:UDP-glucose 6-dehydrogenase
MKKQDDMSERELEETAKRLIATYQFESQRRDGQEAAAIVNVARAYLSSRQSILEEAAKVADEMAANRARVSSAAAYASRSIADRIRSLSHPDKEKGDE